MFEPNKWYLLIGAKEIAIITELNQWLHSDSILLVIFLSTLEKQVLIDSNIEVILASLEEN